MADWKEKVKEILNDRVRITTKFIDENWIEDDGEKADVADIILRHMTRPETYVKREQPKTIRVSHEPLEMEPYDDPYKDEPFLDPEELADPRIREWREILRNKYNFNKRRNNDWRTEK